MFIARFIISLLAIALIVVGVVLTISPIPLGILLVLFGVIILALANPYARPLLKWIRSKWPWFNKSIRSAQQHSPDIISEPLKETDPEE